MDESPAPQLPGRMPSPTLTNPDMILPESQSVGDPASPPRQADDFSALPQWHHSPIGADGPMKSAVRSFFGNGHRLRHKNSDKALKIQENSDVRPQSKQSELRQRSVNSALPSSPLLHEPGTRSMRDSLSRDTATDEPDLLDEGSVISESVSPLVDAEREEYMMSGNGGIDGYKFSDRFRKAMVEEDDETYSHATMSVRAEEILANAKKRLTEMENNLNRARHTINRPSSSMSSFLTSNSDPPSMYTLPQSSSPSKHRQHHSPPSNSKGHSRVFSETSLPSSMQTLPANGEIQGGAILSSSAMGTVDRADTAGGSIKQGSEARDWFWTGLTRSTSHGARHKNSGLQPLNEDGPPPSTFESPERQQSPPIADNDIGMTSSNQNETETSSQERSGSSPTGLTRARSTNQMRDIRDQMQDLKGKISSLKQRAREDSLRRRSLQSLRTPSPFTAAEQWYSGAPTYGRDQSKSMPHEGSPPAIQPAIEEEDEAKHYPVQAPESIGEEAHDPATNGSLRHSGDSEKDVRSMDVPISRDTDDSPRTVIDASAADDEGPANQAPSEDKTLASNQESGKDEGIESEEEDLDESSALPIGGRHEDRPDAFDYEHLFLHSGMGTLGREGKSRSSSHSSMYSVETTKPTNVTTEANEVSSDGGALARADDDSVGVHRNSGHERKGSVESVSTVATFATATEGEGKSSGEDTDEDDWAYRRPMAGSWEPEQPSHRKATSGRKDGPQQSATATKHTPQNWSPRVTINTGADSTGSAREAQTDSTLSPTAMPDLLAFLTSKLPTKDGIAPQSVELNDSDKELAERLVRSVAQVCSQLQAFSMERNKYGGRPWRRRLDGARRVLDGETNGEVF